MLVNEPNAVSKGRAPVVITTTGARSLSYSDADCVSIRDSDVAGTTASGVAADPLMANVGRKTWMRLLPSSETKTSPALLTVR